MAGKPEEWAYERCVANLPENHFVEMVCFPWATLIDLLRNAQLSKAQIYIDALQPPPPPRKTLIRVTICQHIYLQDVLPLLLQLKITDIYWSHAVIGQDYLESIRVHPFPIYPVRCAEMGSKHSSEEAKARIQAREKAKRNGKTPEDRLYEENLF